MPTSKTLPRIIYSCYSEVSRAGEQFIADHVFGYILSGDSELYVNGKNYYFKQGDYRFLKRNELAKFAKHPPQNGEFKTITIGIDQDTLKAMSAELNIQADGRYTGESALFLKPNELFSNYIQSLSPYMDKTAGEINPSLTHHKVKEAVMILLETNPELKNILFDFSEPGKIDLEAFMTKNYRFNVDISRFAYLTGRSLATFKRDFERVFNTSPNRWIQNQRLKDAYYLLKEKGEKVSDVYMEVGFKDLSHFSFAFKKAYGVAPSAV
ncbi:AraC-like DNA-binding protein [Mucilaginibacter oryzae]|uniref:AraC-like DNA-binding protein n=1 Tax=Mucilaginibacter oryzae TaxID=468058 RepID=A0A316HJ64_9SPHI|nr:AraC family transcriptional regulator [Mucilaginibacter oryzae]PWK80183.1 AraC-like DNA-binding protein [Mucilaginibacter oryzae]